MLSLLYVGIEAQQYFVSSTCVFLDKKKIASNWALSRVKLNHLSKNRALHFGLPSSTRNRKRASESSVCARCAARSFREQRGIVLLFVPMWNSHLLIVFLVATKFHKFAINTYCFNKKRLIFPYLSIFLPSSTLISCYFSPFVISVFHRDMKQLFQ